MMNSQMHPNPYGFFIALALWIVLESVAADEANPAGFSTRPDNIEEHTWSSLEAAAQQTKLLPAPEGMGGCFQ